MCSLQLFCIFFFMVHFGWFLFLVVVSLWSANTKKSECRAVIGFFLTHIGISTAWWAGCTASPMITESVRAVGIPCASAASLLDISHSECDALTEVCCYVGRENIWVPFFKNCFFLEEQGSHLRGRRETLKFTVSLLWCSACRHHFCICCGGHQIKAGLGTYVLSDVTLRVALCTFYWIRKQ